MNIILLGAAGFIGSNLTLELLQNEGDFITLADRKQNKFIDAKLSKYKNFKKTRMEFNEGTDFERILDGQQIVYHLISTTVPTTSNQQIAHELEANVVMTARMLDACVKNKVKKVVFISSGGTVYGKNLTCPIRENDVTNPITSYGIQKLTIEKLLFLYQYLYDLEYRVIRLANPYGPYQEPNGLLGVVTSFVYKALHGEAVTVFGDGSVVRDYIYIKDAVRGILNIAYGESDYKTFNLGTGRGTSIKEMIEIIENSLNINLEVIYKPGRKVDVPVNFLNIERYEKEYGKLNPITLEEGVLRTAQFMKENQYLC